MTEKPSSSDPVLVNLNGLLPNLEAIYKDMHSHPELSMPENRTASVAADQLRAADYRRWQDRRCRFVAQRRGADGHATRRSLTQPVWRFSLLRRD